MLTKRNIVSRASKKGSKAKTSVNGITSERYSGTKTHVESEANKDVEMRILIKAIWKNPSVAELKEIFMSYRNISTMKANAYLTLMDSMGPNLQKVILVKELKGYLCKIEGDTAIVHFVINDNEVEYELPSCYMKDNNIVTEGQPFACYIIRTDDGDKSHNQYFFVSKYTPDNYSKSSLQFDDETNKLLELILNEENKD